jgi:putative transcriptional regulator
MTSVSGCDARRPPRSPQDGLLRLQAPSRDDVRVRTAAATSNWPASKGRACASFERTVILIVEHGPDGALGIVINKPIGEQPLASVFKALGQKDGDVVTGSVRVFSGGPIQPEVGFVVHSPDYRRPETVAITDRLSMTSSIAILRDIGDKRGPAKVLVAFGYAGWGPDQLEHEIEERAWGIAEADPKLVFDEDRDNVWEDAWTHRTEHL